MKISLFGGTGFVGTQLGSALQKRGHDVQRLDQRKDKDWRARVIASDAVINLAGSPVFGKRWNARVKEEIRASRVEGTREIVQALKASSRCRVLVNASAVGCYGFRGDEILDENSSFGSDFLAQVCREWEAEAAKAPVRVVLVRTGIVLGPQGGALKQMTLPFKAFVGGPVGSGDQWISWIHIDDIVGIYIFAVENEGLRGPINGTAPDPERNRDLSRVLGEILHRPSWLPVPYVGLRLLFGKLAEALVHGQRALPTKVQALSFAFRFPELQGALEDALKA